MMTAFPTITDIVDYGRPQGTFGEGSGWTSFKFPSWKLG